MSETLESPQVRATDEEIFEAHVGGRLSVGLTAPLDSQRALSIAYTPGVAQVNRAIAADDTLGARYTWADRLVAVVGDGSAVLGLGDIGPAASLPVMEGKCALFKEFAGLDAIPTVLDTNQINNVPAFPGMFRGALDAGARRITEKMMVGAAEAIYCVASGNLAIDRIVPSPLDGRVEEAVAAAVAFASDTSDTWG